MDPNKSASAPPPGFTGDEKSGAGYAAPPPYQDFPQYPNQQPGQYYPPQPQGYGPPPQQPYGGVPYGQGYAPGPGQYPQAGPGQYPQAGPGPQGATVTIQPTVFVTRTPLANPVNDYLGYSIFTMLCCCLPLGIAALIYSISTRDAVKRGDLQKAEQRSTVSRRLNHAALGIGIILCVCVVRFSLFSFRPF